MNSVIQYYLPTTLGLLMSVSLFVYAPFAKTWIRALAVQFLLGFCWAGTRLTSVIVFKEESPPGVFFIIVPLEYLVYASITRGLKLLLFRLPVLKAFEEKLRLRFANTHSDR
jgi:hypothetical protein